MNRYTRLSLAEREEICREMAAGSRLRASARQLGRAPSTVRRELRRAERTRSTYRAMRGQHVARRSAQRPRKLLTPPHLQAYVPTPLTPRGSPEQIVRRLKAEYPANPTMRVSPETIDTDLYTLPRGALKRELLRALRHRLKHRPCGGAVRNDAAPSPRCCASRSVPRGGRIGRCPATGRGI
jgi:transposase, IS30 family